VCDTNRGEVPGVRARIVKPELFRELKTVGGADLQQKASHKRARPPRQHRIRRSSGTCEALLRTQFGLGSRRQTKRQPGTISLTLGEDPATSIQLLLRPGIAVAIQVDGEG